VNPLFQAFEQLPPEDAFRLSLVQAMPLVQLRVSSTVISHMDKLTVAYQLQGHGSPRDWIGAYCINGDATNTPDSDYIDWRWTEGRVVDSVAFGPLTNMRCAWQFRFFTVSADGLAFSKLAESQLVRFAAGPTEPQQVHLAMSEDPSAMRVSWTSASSQSASVWFGSAPEKLDRVALANATTYHASDMCGPPATVVSAQFFRDPGMLYDAVMDGLVASATYYYRVGSSMDGQSPIYSFKTPPPVGTQSHATSFFVFGDLGDWNIKATSPKPDDRTETTIELMRQDIQNDTVHDYLAVFHVGDLAYAMGRTYLWDQFGSLLEPVSTKLPYMVGIGNHEYDYLSGGENKDMSGAGMTNGFHPQQGNYGGDSQGECGVPYNKRYIMPSNGNGAFWWSIDVALTHHVMLSSEHDFRANSSMYEWLVNDLKSVNRAKTPWLIVHTHRPMYCSVMYPADYRLSLYLRSQLEPLLARFRVDLVFSGHYHSYERTCAVYNGRCHSNPTGDSLSQAPVHIMVGAAGANIDNAPYYDVPWRVAALMDYGYGRLHIHNASHAQFEFTRNRARSVVDATWIVSHHNWTVGQ
jgi:acid phosphatase type 7